MRVRVRVRCLTAVSASLLLFLTGGFLVTHNCAKVHAHLLNHMRGKFGMFGKKKDQTKMLQDEQLAEIFRTVQQTANLPQGDFPSMKLFREKVEKYEIWKFPKLDKKLVTQMEEVLSRDIPALMRHLPQEDAAKFKGSPTRSDARRCRRRCT